VEYRSIDRDTNQAIPLRLPKLAYDIRNLRCNDRQIQNQSFQLSATTKARETAGYWWTLRDSKGYEINCSSGSLGKNQTAYDAEVAAIEEGINAVSKSQQAFKHLSIFSDSTSAIARVKHNKTGPGQSRATKVIRHIQRLKAQGKTASKDWVHGHNNVPGNDRADELAGQAAELLVPHPRLANAVSIAWMRKIVSEQSTTAANIELREKGKHTITPPPPKKRSHEGCWLSHHTTHKIPLE
jgi:ribonuclease HI